MTVVEFSKAKRTGPRLSDGDRKRLAREALLAATMLSKISGVARKSITGKRQDRDAFIVRSIFCAFMVGSRRCPKKYLSKIMGVNRDIPGEDEQRVEHWCAISPYVLAGVERINGWLFDGINLREDMAEIMGGLSRVDRGEVAGDPDEPEEVEEIEEAPAPKARPFNPALDGKPDIATMMRREEASKLAAEAQARRQMESHQRAVSICQKLIDNGEQPGAKKEARDYAKAARLALSEINGAGFIAAGNLADADRATKARARRTEKALREIVGIAA